MTSLLHMLSMGMDFAKAFVSPLSLPISIGDDDSYLVALELTHPLTETNRSSLGHLLVLTCCQLFQNFSPLLSASLYRTFLQLLRSDYRVGSHRPTRTGRLLVTTVTVIWAFAAPHSINRYRAAKPTALLAP